VIRSIATVPQPPLLVPELVGTAVAEVDDLRAACQQAVRRLGAGSWHAIGVDGSGPTVLPSGARGSFRGYGVDVPVSLGASLDGGGTGELPLPLLVAGWLRGQAGADAVVGELIHPSTSPEDGFARGRALARELCDRDWALLVLADGARTHPAPGAGRVDERAAGFDAVVAAALAAADADALAGLDAELAADLGAHGRAAWQVLAGAATGSGPGWRAELLYSAAPYGVGYHVALWEPR